MDPATAEALASAPPEPVPVPPAVAVDDDDLVEEVEEELLVEEISIDGMCGVY